MRHDLNVQEIVQLNIDFSKKGHVSFAVGSVTVVSPLELIKTQMQYRRLSYKQLYLCISTKVAVDGWFSLWAGWTSTILRDVPFSGKVYFLSRFLFMFLYSFFLCFQVILMVGFRKDWYLLFWAFLFIIFLKNVISFPPVLFVDTR